MNRTCYLLSPSATNPLLRIAQILQTGPLTFKRDATVVSWTMQERVVLKKRGKQSISAIVVRAKRHLKRVLNDHSKKSDSRERTTIAIIFTSAKTMDRERDNGNIIATSRQSLRLENPRGGNLDTIWTTDCWVGLAEWQARFRLFAYRDDTVGTRLDFQSWRR